MEVIQKGPNEITHHDQDFANDKQRIVAELISIRSDVNYYIDEVLGEFEELESRYMSAAQKANQMHSYMEERMEDSLLRLERLEHFLKKLEDEA